MRVSAGVGVFCYLEMKSSLSYQLLLYLGSYYCLGFIATEVLLLVYKSIILPYQSLTLVSEVIIKYF